MRPSAANRYTLKWALLLLLIILPIFVNCAAIAKKKNVSSDPLGDLIPIPDHLLDSYKPDQDLEDEEEASNEIGNTLDGSKKSSATVSTPVNLLPKSVPTGDPAQFALPIFLKEPTDTYLIKSRPATLHCRVGHALGVHFQCNSEVVEPSSREDHVEPETGIRYTEASVEIKREQVEAYFPEFHCACVAFSGKGSVVSRHALVSYAYLKKHFEVPPYSQQVSRGGQVEMRCHPPKGRPLPTLYWLQNGRKIDPATTDKNFIVTGEGHLIVVAAKLTDTANYTCVAENIATTRYSDPATITVYVDGGWSAWSTWSTCSPRCGKGLQKRTRQCNSPSALNGGQPCKGSPVQKKQCSSQCQGLNGGWSDWSSWSSCSPECFQHRRRTCTNPPPSELGGKYCDGIDLQSRNCSHGFCQDTGQLVMYGNGGEVQKPSEDKNNSKVASSPSGTNSIGSTSDVTLYIVFGVALLVFVIVIVVIIKIMKRKNTNPNGYTLTSTDYGYGSEESKKTTLGYSPDITHNVATVGSAGSGSAVSGGGVTLHTGHATPTTVCYEYSYPDSNSNHSKSGFVRPISEHHYEQPMMVLPPSQSPSDSLDKPSRSETSSSVSNGDRGHSSPSHGSYDRGTSLAPSTSFPVTSTPLPSLVTPPPPPPLTKPPPQTLIGHSPDPRFTTWASVTSAGARLTVPDSDVCVTIPPGSVSNGRSVDLFASVVHHARPPLGSTETLLSPLVCIGPRDSAVQLKKAVVLTVPHCASLRHGHWKVSLLQSDAECFHNDNDHLRPWSRAVTLGQETLNTPAYVQLDVNAAHIMTDVLASFALTGESAATGLAGKSLQLAAFAQEAAHCAADLTVRVYVLPDCAATLAYVADSERRYNGRLLDKPLSFLLRDGGQDLCLGVDSVSSQWCCQKGADYLEVPFAHIWQSSNQPSLHCSFTFRSTHRQERPSSSKLNLAISVCQKNSPKSVLRINCDLAQPATGGLHGMTTTSSTGSSCSNNNPPSNNLVSDASRFRLNATMLSSLSKLLDPPTTQGHDWRLLAERLNVHRYVTFFATRPSPTEAILHLWEARNREILALSNLINILRGMGRFDAAAVIEQQLQIH